MRKLCLCVVSCCFLMFAFTAVGQVQNGQFQGTVIDPTGAAIAGAKVTITNTGTNLTVNTTTNPAGLYVAKELPIGTYKITAEAPGFKTKADTNVTLNAGTIQRVDFRMEVGQANTVVEVSGEVAAVQTDDSKLSQTVSGAEIANLPLNGRNVYDLIQVTPGAVNVRGVMTENGANTVVNGVRENFNGFLINGVSNKGLSGGFDNQPIQDTVQEFQELTLNMSAQYGNSAGSVTNLVTKSGTNAFHGSLWEFFRNDKLDANNYFLNQSLQAKPPLRFNQFGGTFGGPIIKDKLFFFASYQGDRFVVSNTPSTQFIESPEWDAAVAAANPTSVAALLYTTFPAKTNISAGQDLASWLAGGNGTAFSTPGDYVCPNNYPAGSPIPQRIANVIGVTAADQAGCGSPLPLQVGTFDRTLNFEDTTVSVFQQQTQGNLFNGNEASLRLDYNPGQKDRIFTQFNWEKTTDKFGPGLPDSARGFTNPQKIILPNFQISFVHTFTPSFLNEFRAGYVGNINLINTNLPGVPLVGMDDTTMGFGSYNGYPQFFKENVYTYSDMVSVSHGAHSIKAGVDFRRNIENSEFNVGRPSYYFFDSLFFAADAPYTEAAGVDPGIVSGSPAHLQSNVRHWRNLEMGAYLQDDWKVSKRLTLNLGLRYDLYQRHHELNNLATTFIKGPGTTVIDNITTGAGFIHDANAPAGTPGVCDTPTEIAQAQLAGVCGSGGFQAAKSLGKGDHNNFGPRIGFAWDVFGNGKTALRGGYGLSYEGTLYNPLSNSRWNLPYYSFNSATNALAGGTDTVNYGPQSGGAPRFTGPPDPLNFQGAGSATAIGNIQAWAPSNANLAVLTGIIFPEGIRDPYVHNFYFGFQHEVFANTTLEVNYVGTAGHKLFRAEDVNRIPGGSLPAGLCTTDTFGRKLCSQEGPFNATGRLNPNYATLRNWQNVVNSDYNSMQVALRHRLSHGVQFNVNYTWSHSIDNGSTWHSGATTSNGPAAGEGFTTDQTMPQLDRGNSIYDIRHRIVATYIWSPPIFQNTAGFLRTAFGGWQFNGDISYQTGAHWSPYSRKVSGVDCSDFTDISTCTNTGGDFNLDNGVDGGNDRPNAAAPNVNATHDMWANGWGAPYSLSGDGSAANPGNTFFTRPCLGCVGSEGRNTFVGPNFWAADISLFKNFKITENTNIQFRAEGFNVFNRTNFELPGAAGATHNRVTSGSFGQAGAAFSPRQLQLGLKLQF
jgi:hypothetical protein